MWSRRSANGSKCARNLASRRAIFGGRMSLRNKHRATTTETASNRQGGFMRYFLTRFAFLATVLFAAAGFAQDYQKILADPSRPQAERDIDAVRKPDQMLKFFGVKPGDKVADLMASRGYYTAILSQAVRS